MIERAGKQAKAFVEWSKMCRAFGEKGNLAAAAAAAAAATSKRCPSAHTAIFSRGAYLSFSRSFVVAAIGICVCVHACWLTHNAATD